MILSSHLVDPVCQQVLSYQRDTHVGRYSEIESWETHPQLCHSLFLHRLTHRVENVLVWELTISVLLHLLDLCLCVVEW